jgi:hypothetical protein
MPDDSERLVIGGRTGGGKTMEAIHHLSQRSIGEIPWCVIDFKGDDLVARIPVSGAASIHDGPPGDPGVYVVRAEIEDHGKGGPVDAFLTACYEQGNTGVLIDEGYMVGQHCRGLRLLLTQGRSKGCPLIILTQRPVNLDVYAWSESEYLQIFYMQHPDDQERVKSYVPRDRIDFDKLRAAGLYHSLWYDVREDHLELLGPCPPFEQLYDRILKRLPVYVQPQQDAAGLRPKRVRV